MVLFAAFSLQCLKQNKRLEKKNGRDNLPDNVKYSFGSQVITDITEAQNPSVYLGHQRNSRRNAH